LVNGGSPTKIVEERGLAQLSDPDAIAAIIDEVIAANPKELEQYRGGKTKLLGFFVGQVLKKTSGRANPKLTNQLLAQKLNP
jgi:aspartyl-tRNA(Asn)/glutamyl-tRNA(Gln) amidotransferase subunit B